jgi:hypothetical protein
VDIERVMVVNNSSVDMHWRWRRGEILVLRDLRLGVRIRGRDTVGQNGASFAVDGHRRTNLLGCAAKGQLDVGTGRPDDIISSTVGIESAAYQDIYY